MPANTHPCLSENASRISTKCNIARTTSQRELLKLAVIACFAAALATGARGSIPDFHQETRIRETIRKMESKGLSVGLYAVKCGSESVSLSVNGEIPRIPASVQKTLTTGAALLKLGPDFRFQTRLYATGPVTDTAIQGDLVLSGDGDPSLTGRWTGGIPESIFRGWAKTLRERGIQEINGDIIGDDDLFSDEPTAPGWEEYTNTDWYTAEVSALSFNDNCIDVKVTPGKSIGAAATVTTTPDTKYVRIDGSQLVTKGSKGGWVFGLTRETGTNLLVMKGRPAAGTASRMESVTIHNPTLYTTTVLAEALERSGIRVAGSPRDIDDAEASAFKRRSRAIPSHWTLLASHNSPPLSEIITVTNQRSQNLYAELLARRLGADVLGDGGFAGAARSIRKIWQDMGIDVSGLRMVDGSGLSRQNLVAPKVIVDSLAAMNRHEYGGIYRDSLAQAGQAGTLKNRFYKTPLWNNLWGKTGYVGGVRSLAGIARCPDGRYLSFAILVNGPEKIMNSSRMDIDELAALLMG